MLRFLSDLTATPFTQWLSNIGALALARLPRGASVGPAIPLLAPFFPRKQIDQAIGPSEQLLAAFMDNLPGYLWIKDPQGRYLYVNEGVKSLAPYQNGWLGKTDAEIWPEQVAAIFRKNDLQVILTAAKVETLEVFHLSGEQRQSLVTKFPIFDENGTVTMVGGSGVDITEHKRVEVALRESERFRRTMIESEPECVKFVAPDYTLLDMNPAGLEMIGATSREQVVGRSMLDLVAPEFIAAYKGMHQRVCQGESVVAEFEMVGLNGTRRRMESHAVPLHDQSSRLLGRLAITRDITKRKHTEDQLRQAEARYRSIFENAIEGIFQTTPDGRFVAANPAMARIYGFDSPDELINTRTDIAQQLYVDPKSREAFKRGLERQGFIVDFELEAYRKDGSKIWISENVRAVRDEEGSVIYYEGTTQDITGRKLAEEALRSSEERYRELFENAQDGIYVHDLSGKYSSVNRAIEKLSGYSRAEILGKDFIKFVAPEYVREVRESFCQKLQEQGETSYEVQILTKDGRRVPVEVHSNLIYENGSPVGVQGLVRDVTERRSAEQAIREAEQKFRGIFENAGEGIFQTTPEGRFLDANPALARMLGFDSPEELICDRDDISRQVYVDPTLRDEFKRRLEANGAVSGFEGQAFRKDGSKIWITVNARAVRDAERQILYYEGAAQDVTERKRAEAALRNYSRLLMEAQETERQNIARELHDQIGQLLTAIRINLQTVRDSSKTASSKALTDEGMTLVDHALGQVRDLSFELRPSLLDDLGLIAALRWYVDRYTQRTGIKASRVIELGGKRLPRELETACFRIVQEALTNVARYAKATEVVINLERLTNAIFLSIKDNGCGFDTASINPRSVPIRLGLRGMEERVLALGGRLAIESGPAKGTEVLAFFPDEEGQNQGDARRIDHKYLWTEAGPI